MPCHHIILYGMLINIHGTFMKLLVSTCYCIESVCMEMLYIEWVVAVMIGILQTEDVIPCLQLTQQYQVKHKKHVVKGASGPWRRAFFKALGEWDREALWNLAEPQSWEVLVGMLAPSRYVCAIFHEPRPRGLPAVEWQGAPAARVSAGCHRDERC